MSTGYTQGRMQRAKLHHVCQSGHVILPGDPYYVGFTFPGSGSYMVYGEYEQESWDWDWGKLCISCYYGALGDERGDAMPPACRGFSHPKYRRAVEQALRNGHLLHCDDVGANRLTCTHRSCGKAMLMPEWGVVYGSAITDKCEATEVPA